ncbi:type 2 lantipeptide synthetase LanM family protein [Dyella sp. LX-66]|uniref:type 2 lanthipeptide synthetase LanM family protein n=1 Tax=unclassified Dyella TaxID=2634549 RepID=UPI001BE124E2|nr:MULTISPECIES: type 2 lanthipeptide synthetase LanM family protein [unclassified Dyella]MBT2117393.1 type 2 lantipeptide synthetase LanM family protein [Dyella sp. LX-1]MBT2138457.1 type 2 lantipeptide synthetase LanM family protein [Dyella sp. LX-66]
MGDAPSNDTFLGIIDHLTADARRSLAERIRAVPGLGDGESAILIRQAHQALRDNAERKLNRVLLLELHAAKLSGQLTAPDESGKFAQFLELARQDAFKETLRRRYPVLEERLDRALGQQSEAILTLAQRIVADRAAFAALLGQPAGALRAASLGQGDVHDGGQSVAQLEFGGGRLMYKPRSVRVDQALESFLHDLFQGAADRIRVPAVLDRGAYGWTAFVEHRHCADQDELKTFYRNIGHWLAVLRLLGGTDVHHENLIACGPVPYVVDVESLFVPEPPPQATELGQAVDLADAMIRSSVLRTGLVPFRAPALGMDGVDISAIGALPGQQPKIRVPEIVNHGTSDARVGLVSIDVDMARNHPCENPDISRFWPDILAGFQQLTGRFAALHRDGALAPKLKLFLGSRIRLILRPTQIYVEVMRMLWHPASLHDEPAAIERARDLLEKNSAASLVAPRDAAAIRAEIDDMRYGDVPVFANELDQAQLDEIFGAWQAMRLDLEELTIRGALVTAHLNGRLNDDKRAPYDLRPSDPSARDLDRRRRTMAALTVQELLELSVRGEDGSVTWISPILGRAGWAMRSLQPNLYVGLCGVAITLAAYVREMRAGRADDVAGVQEALDGVLKVMRSTERARPIEAVGGFIGVGSQILSWLTLHAFQPQSDFLAMAIARAEAMERRAFSEERNFDILEGVSGAIVPLLQLADATGDARWLALAAKAARRLEEAAIVDARGARWPAAVYDEPLGGFAHGSTGIGWVLTRLGLSGAGSAEDRRRWLALGERAFDFEESLYLPEFGNWLDVRKPDSREFPNTWCHGSVGIGLAACDLYLRTGEDRHLETLRRAVQAAKHGGWGYSHTLCHGDLSMWELLLRASKLVPDLLPSQAMPGSAVILSSIEEHGIVGGLARDAFTPGLMSGISGSIHQLLRMHPDCDIPSPLLMEARLGEYARNRAFEQEGLTA